MKVNKGVLELGFACKMRMEQVPNIFTQMVAEKW